MPLIGNAFVPPTAVTPGSALQSLEQLLIKLREARAVSVRRLRVCGIETVMATALSALKPRIHFQQTLKTSA